MDFTLKTYKVLLNALRKQGFSFQTFQEYIENKSIMLNGVPDSPSGDTGVRESQNKTIMLRHDVDKLPENYSQAREISRLFYTGFD